MSQGYYLHQLSTAIKDVLPAKCRKDFDAWMQNGTLQLTPKDGGTGVELARLNYQAVFMVEDLPFRELDPAVVLATVAAWLPGCRTLMPTANGWNCLTRIMTWSRSTSTAPTSPSACCFPSPC